jgi:hypothetical protein
MNERSIKIVQGAGLALALPFIIGHGLGSTKPISDCFEYFTCNADCVDRHEGVCSPTITVSGSSNREDDISGEGICSIRSYDTDADLAFVDMTEFELALDNSISPITVDLPFGGYNDFGGYNHFSGAQVTIDCEPLDGRLQLDQLWLHSDKGKVKLLDNVVFNAVSPGGLQLYFELYEGDFKEGVSESNAASGAYYLSSDRLGSVGILGANLSLYVNDAEIQTFSRAELIDPINIPVTLNDSFRIVYEPLERGGIDKPTELWLHNPDGEAKNLLREGGFIFNEGDRLDISFSVEH